MCIFHVVFDFLVFCVSFFFVAALFLLYIFSLFFEQDRHSLYVPIYSYKSESMTSDFRKIFVWNSLLN